MYDTWAEVCWDGCLMIMEVTSFSLGDGKCMKKYVCRLSACVPHPPNRGTDTVSTGRGG